MKKNKQSITRTPLNEIILDLEFCYLVPNSMTWSTSDALCSDIFRSTYDWNAVITFKRIPKTKLRTTIKLKTRLCRLYLFEALGIGIPVIIRQFLMTMNWVPVTWMPSVLGLFPGAYIQRFRALTLLHLWKERCICCAFLNLSPSTLRLVHW